MLRGRGLTAHKNPAKKLRDKVGWDIRFTLDGLEFDAEVKTDKMMARTGNLAVEYWNPRSDKPSGIFASTSELWVVVTGDEIWACGTLDLRERMSGPCLRDVRVAGDGNASLKLFRRGDVFGTLFRRINDANSEELTSLLREMLGANVAEFISVV